MNILLTGGTGYVGGAVLDLLIRRGHTVTALVRSEKAAAAVRTLGAVPLVGDITDVSWLCKHLRSADAAIHAAAPGDGTAAEFDAVVVKAVIDSFADTAKPYVHTGGVWVYGNGAQITEAGPLSPPAITAWRPDLEREVLTADLAATVVVPGIVYGHGRGIPGLISGGPRTAAGALTLIGDGRQHWTTVHVDDLAALYVLVLERGSGLGHVIGVSGSNPTVRELGRAVAGAAGVHPETVDSTRERLGGPFADALLLDQQASGAKARSLGWVPTRRSLLEEFTDGTYGR